MTNKVTIIPHNEVYFKLSCEPGILQELAEYFTFYVPNYKHTPQFKKGMWDGKIRLLNKRHGLLYAGLENHVQQFCNEREYELVSPFAADEFSEKVALDFIKALKIPDKFEMRYYQLETFIYCVRNRRALFVSPTACHKKDDLVFTSTGWKLIQDIKVGDKVFGADGKEKTILRTFNGKAPLFEINPSNNRSKITITGEHILAIKHTDAKTKYGYAKNDPDTVEYISVNEYIKKSKYFKHCSVLFYNNIPLQFGTQPKTKLSPYFIGCYLGDGHTHNCAITTKDKEIVQAIHEEAKRFNYTVSQRKNTITYNIIKKDNESKRNLILHEFELFGLNFINNDTRTKCENKFIPKDFLESNLEFRKELLAGLIDTDGHLANGSYFEFCSKSHQLALDVQQLAVSLGLISYIKEKFNKKYQKTYYKTIIMGNIDQIPTRIPRKQFVQKPRQRRPYVSKFTIRPIDEQDFYGFEVENNLYITNDGMITHNSGKSLMIYMLIRWYQEIHSLKTLLIVPSINLINQMTGDFVDYGYNAKHIHQIYEGQEHYSHCPITISTWQSLMKEDEAFFSQFGVVIVDEAHGAKAKEVKEILHKMPNCKYRFGFTGTLDGTLTHKMVLEGLFGAHKQIVTTKELMDQGYLATLLIKCLEFKYEETTRKALKKVDYDTEIKWLETFNPRNKAIINLAHSLDGNVLVLYQHIDMHGIPLFEMTKENIGDRPLYIVHGRIDNDDVEDIRKIVNTHKTSITYASINKFSKGINIPNMDYIILPSPTKSRINIMQSIGRGLRTSKTKQNLIVFDIADDLSYKSWKNHTYKHFEKRIEYYCEEQFDYKLYKIQLK